MGLTKTEKELNNLSESAISVVWLIYIYLSDSILHILPEPIGNFTNSCSWKLFERNLVAHFLLDNSNKGFFSKGIDAERWWEIKLVAFLTLSVLAACLHARNEMDSFFFPLIANMFFVSIKLFLPGKGFSDFLPFWIALCIIQG